MRNPTLVFLFALLGLLTLVRPCAVSAAPATAQRPNIIFILADDLGAKELGCYGNKEYRTPNLDRMAAEGTRFETFYVMPLCTPTRVCLMTGQYGFRTGYLGMANPAFVPLPGAPEKAISHHFTNGKLMQSAGYATALAGKWQLSGKLPTLIHDAGFDHYRMWAYDSNLPPGIIHPSHESNPQAAASRYFYPSIVEDGKYLPTKADDFGPDLFNDYVMNFPREHREQPFFIYYTSVLTHTPRTETPDPTRPGARWPKGFKSNLEYLDYLMGKLFSSLKANGLDENTLVFFVGDNGTSPDGTDGGGKGKVIEMGVRVPAIVRGPGVQRGFVSRALADATDIMPTLAEYSGTPLPTDRIYDGHSLGPVLRGEAKQHRDWIYSHLDDGRLLRDARWLLEINRGNREKFYDCGESRDGSGYRDVTDSADPEVKAARAKFAEILASIPEPKPHPNVANVPGEETDQPSRAEARKARKAKKQ